jgi:hypothetical protein
LCDTFSSSLFSYFRNTVFLFLLPFQNQESTILSHQPWPARGTSFPSSNQPVGKDSRTNSAASSSVHFSPVSYNTCNTESTFVSPGLLRQNSVRERPALQGYPKLARFIGERPGFAIFRRFSELNARNLLYLQAELLDVEEELYETEIDDQRDQDLRQLQFSMRGIHNGRSVLQTWLSCCS